jgi:hypothetical protein
LVFLFCPSNSFCCFFRNFFLAKRSLLGSNPVYAQTHINKHTIWETSLNIIDFAWQKEGYGHPIVIKVPFWWLFVWISLHWQNREGSSSSLFSPPLHISPIEKINKNVSIPLDRFTFIKPCYERRHKHKSKVNGEYNVSLPCCKSWDFCRDLCPWSEPSLNHFDCEEQNIIYNIIVVPL